jgi:beta-glucosidase
MVDEHTRRAEELCAQLTLDEKIDLLSGATPFWPGMIEMLGEGYNLRPYVAGAVERLGIEGIRFTDGPRGVTVGHSTCFPVAMARGATFDPELEERVGDAIGREARAQGANLFAGVCVNLLRHPAWGRAQETYGEDPEHVGEMGAALVRGVQRHVMACVKHFALNSMEDARFQVDVRATDEVLDEVYLPQFERIVREGVAAVMSAYNAVNGQWCGQNHELLTTILRDRWGFDGFVLSDFIFGVRDSAASINAGLDLEMPFRMVHDRDLADAVARGEVSTETIDRSVARLLRTQLRFAKTEAELEGYPLEVVACKAHRDLAREVATRSIVLLRNEPVAEDPVLPLDSGSLRTVAVVGRLAAVPNTGDHGSSDVRPPYVVTPLDGLRVALEPIGVDVRYDDGSDRSRAARVAADADAVIAVVGYTHDDEGENVGRTPAELVANFPPLPDELAPAVADALAGGRGAGERGGIGQGGDRRSLTLRPEHEALIATLAAASDHVVVVLMCASAVLMERWRHTVPGIVILWYPGMEGGHALADILLGHEAPTGRLPFAIPTSAEHLPPFDAQATSIEYGALHGQRLLDELGVEAAYPFGFGLSYG